MKLVRIAGLAVAVGLVALGTLFAVLPRTLHLEARRLVHANAATVGAYVSDLSEWRGWTTWLGATGDPTARVAFAGDVPGVGQSVTWAGRTIGDGRVALTRVDDQGGVSFSGTIDGFAGIGRIDLAPAGGGAVAVRFVFDGRAGWNLLARLTVKSASNRVRVGLEKSLADLAQLSEHTLRPPGRLPKPQVLHIATDAPKKP